MDADFAGAVPAWVVLALLSVVGTLVMLLWSGLNSRVKALEQRYADLVSKEPGIAGRLAELETKVDSLVSTAEKLDTTTEELQKTVGNLNTLVGVLNSKLLGHK